VLLAPEVEGEAVLHRRTPPAEAHGDSSSPVVVAGSGREVGNGGGETAAYAARYYRARGAASPAPAQPQDLELMRRLHEMPEASGLFLQFGPHKGNTVALVAMHDPDYVRQLVVRAQRPCSRCWRTSQPSHARFDLYHCTTNSNSRFSCSGNTIGLNSLSPRRCHRMLCGFAHAHLAKAALLQSIE